MNEITAEGRVTIPKEIREEIGLRPGDDVEFEKTDEGYVIRKAVEENRFEKWRGAANTATNVEEHTEELRGRGE